MSDLSRTERLLLLTARQHPGKAKSRLQELSGVTTSQATHQALRGLLRQGLIRIELEAEPDPRWGTQAQRVWAV